MHLFFAVTVKSGGALNRAERQWFTDIVRQEVCIAGHLCRTFSLEPTARSMVALVSNEPSGGHFRTATNTVLFCGYAADEEELGHLTASSELAEQASQCGGRFAALVVDHSTGHFAMATQMARVDSIFVASTERFIFWGNQASVLSILRDRAIKFSPPQLLTLLHAGFFGDHATPYEGVEVLAPLTTVCVQGDQIHERSVSLASFKKGMDGWNDPSSIGAPFEHNGDAQLEALSSIFRSSFSPLRRKPSISVGLTGGMDSRLILAGALAEGLDVDCFTIQTGDANAPDIQIAKRVAELAGVKHRLVERSRKVREDRDTPEGLLRICRNTLSTSDGMLGVQYPASTSFAHTADISLAGLGGEVLRGGYGEKVRRPNRETVSKLATSLWCFLPELAQQELVATQIAQAADWLERYPAMVTAGDILDCLYVDRRCGRWVAASNRGSTRRITPLLDNRLVGAVIAVPIGVKRQQKLHRALLGRLLPQVDHVPLAEKFWMGTAADEQARIRQRWPEAFPKAEVSCAAAGVPREISDGREQAMRRYVFADDRLALLGELVRIDSVIEYFRQHPSNPRARPLPQWPLYGLRAAFRELATYSLAGYEVRRRTEVARSG